jgi:hypothetical protein
MAKYKMKQNKSLKIRLTLILHSQMKTIRAYHVIKEEQTKSIVIDNDELIDFVKTAESKDIAPSSMKAVDVADEKVCIINIEGNYYAIGNKVRYI